MNTRLVWRSGLGVAALLATIGVAWILSLPPAPATGVVPPIAQEEADATIAALKPPKRPRPLIAIIGVNDATETTDYLMPYGILRRADVAEVVALATEPGPVTLYPALKVEPQATVADFDARHHGRRRLCHRPGHAPRRRPGGPAMDQASGGHRVRSSSASAPEPRSSQGRAARRQAGDDPLVLSRGAARASIPRSTTSRTGGWWSTGASRRRRGSPRPCRWRSP